jgi:hypothetical protein
MAFQKPAVFLALVSLGVGLGAVFLGFGSAKSSGYAYVVLSFPESYPDKVIGDLLQQGGMSGYISESTQWVFLDDFGTLARVPLDEYRNRVEPFDPRNDGYARKLEDFFIRAGRRRFFLPLAPSFPGERRFFLKGLGTALEGIPHTVEFLGSPGSPLWQILLFVPAAAVTLFLSGSLFPAFFLFPLTAAWIFSGPAGFASAAALAGLYRVLLDPVREFFASRRYGRRYTGGLFAPQWGMAAVFLAVYGIIWLLGGIPVLLGALGLLFFFFLLALSLWAESAGGRDHIRFVPVLITVPPLRRVLGFSMVIPFACASLVSLFFPLLSGIGVQEPRTRPEVPAMVSPGDYERHLAFQGAFSRIPLGQYQDEGEAGIGNFDTFKYPPYLRYYIGDDGLIGETGEYPEEPGLDFPPFPLEDLMRFIGGYGNIPAYAPGDIISVLIALGLCVPPLFRAGWNHRKKKKMVVYNDKRIAA